MTRLLHIGIAFWAVTAVAALVFPGVEEECSCMAAAVGHDSDDCGCEHEDEDEALPCACCDRAESEPADGNERINIASVSASVRSVMALHAGIAPPPPAATLESTFVTAAPPASRAPPVYLMVSSFLI